LFYVAIPADDARHNSAVAEDLLLMNRLDSSIWSLKNMAKGGVTGLHLPANPAPRNPPGSLPP
jgi:hypothetical protein